MPQTHPPSDDSGMRRLASRVGRFVAGVVYVLAILAVANVLTNLLNPMPFEIYNKQTWSAQEFEAFDRWASRGSWLGWLDIAVCAGIFNVVRSRVRVWMRRRRTDGPAAA